MPRRNRTVILLDTLVAVAEKDASASDSLWRLAGTVNVSYPRLLEVLDDLQKLGLLTSTRPLALTEEGRDVVRHYHGWRSTLRRHGLESGPGRTTGPDGES